MNRKILAIFTVAIVFVVATLGIQIWRLYDGREIDGGYVDTYGDNGGTVDTFGNKGGTVDTYGDKGGTVDTSGNPKK